MNRPAELERDLSAVIAKHADWLTGGDWLVAAEQLGRGHFHDMPPLIDREAFAAELVRLSQSTAIPPSQRFERVPRKVA